MALAGCAPASTPVQTPATVQPLSVSRDQFRVVEKDGVAIACPRDWHEDPDPNLVYGVSRSDTVRIIVAVLDALPASYYEGLAARGTVTRTTIAGCPAYRNDYTYPFGNYELTTRCITVVDGGKACHIMVLCDVAVMGAFAPTFQYVLDSLKFL